MNIDQYALALMALESLLLGALLEIIFELLRFVDSPNKIAFS